MEGWIGFLFYATLLFGGAILLTLYAAWFSGRGERRAEGGYPRRLESERGVIAAIAGNAERLSTIELKIEKTSQLIAYTLSLGGGKADEGLVEKQRLFLGYLIDYADRYCALILEQAYASELDWFLTLLDEESWMERCAAFREHLRTVYEGLASRRYFTTHERLDRALGSILEDFDATARKLVVSHTGQLLWGESPLEAAENLRRDGETTKEGLARSLAELDRAFDRFLAEEELS